MDWSRVTNVGPRPWIPGTSLEGVPMRVKALVSVKTLVLVADCSRDSTNAEHQDLIMQPRQESANTSVEVVGGH